MNFWNFLSKRTSQRERNYLQHLFRIAGADGRLDDTEMKYIVSIGKRLNFSEEDIQALAHEVRQQNNLPLPNHQDGRFFMLFSLINLILVDNEVHPEEIRITESIVMQLGYDPSTVYTILETISHNKSNGVPPEATYQYLQKYLA